MPGSSSCQKATTKDPFSSAVETYDLESVGHNADGLELLAVVAAVHHERVGETLDDGALGLAETLGGIAASSVRKVDGRTNLNVVAVCA